MSNLWNSSQKSPILKNYIRMGVPLFLCGYTPLKFLVPYLIRLNFGLNYNFKLKSYYFWGKEKAPNEEAFLLVVWSYERGLDHGIEGTIWDWMRMYKSLMHTQQYITDMIPTWITSSRFSSLLLSYYLVPLDYPQV